MIKLQKLNVVKLVEEEVEAQAWERRGFKRIVEAEPADPEKGIDLDKPVDDMTVPELKAYAKLKEIDLDGVTKKDDILAAIKAKEEGGE
ncbi:hypothetical protein [Fontibacillus sp. BL9]|uniref:hypothetical protein n=1 Tax=Fontibacillus sp. BL9 TaxID=3389971 RepID=UPI00397BB3AD